MTIIWFWLFPSAGSGSSSTRSLPGIPSSMRRMLLCKWESQSRTNKICTNSHLQCTLKSMGSDGHTRLCTHHIICNDTFFYAFLLHIFCIPGAHFMNLLILLGCFRAVLCLDLKAPPANMSLLVSRWPNMRSILLFSFRSCLLL